MNTKRSQIVQDLFNQHKVLMLDNAEYKQRVFKYTFVELEKDLGEAGDITTKSLLKEDVKVDAVIVAKEDGVLCGLEEIRYFISESDKQFRPRLYNIEVESDFKDGDAFKKGDEIIKLSGLASDILKSERVILNLLQHMSGIATYTKGIVEKAKAANPDVLVVPTRKTTWDWLDKKAVVCGGGGTHRLNLADAILIKDNHLALYGNDVEKLLENLDVKPYKYKFVELELDDPEEVISTLEFIKGHEELSKINPFVIMFDNMQPDTITKLLGEIKEKDLYDDFIFEASGGINEGNVGEYAKTGVDVISMGALTQRLKGLDLGLDVREIS